MPVGIAGGPKPLFRCPAGLRRRATVRPGASAGAPVSCPGACCWTDCIRINININNNMNINIAKDVKCYIDQNGLIKP